nr:hypothetical protein [uncultured Acetatifactor sp.]
MPVYAARDSENGAGLNADGKREVPAYAARDSENGAGLKRTGGQKRGKGAGRFELHRPAGHKTGRDSPAM